jgi:hypothetical protein
MIDEVRASRRWQPDRSWCRVRGAPGVRGSVLLGAIYLPLAFYQASFPDSCVARIPG